MFEHACSIFMWSGVGCICFRIVSWSLTHVVTNCGMLLQFQATYGKPLLAAKDSKCSAKDAEAGVLAMEALHKQVEVRKQFILL